MVGAAASAGTVGAIAAVTDDRGIIMAIGPATGSGITAPATAAGIIGPATGVGIIGTAADIADGDRRAPSPRREKSLAQWAANRSTI